jgi:hypothetical protein
MKAAATVRGFWRVNPTAVDVMREPDGKPLEEFRAARRDQTARPGIAAISKDADETVSIHLITIVSCTRLFLAWLNSISLTARTPGYLLLVRWISQSPSGPEMALIAVWV